jgi:flagellin
MRELAVQASSGTLTDSDRAALNTEFTQLQANISDTIDSASFNGQPLLSQDGSIQVTTDANASTSVDIPTVDMAANSATGIGAYLDSSTFNINNVTNAQVAIGGIDEAINRVETNRAEIGASASRLDSAVGSIQAIAEAQATSRARIVDADFARETANQSALQIRQQAGISLLGQGNLNSSLVSALLGG